MPTLENVPVDKLFAMLKGEPGTRKSTQALSFPLPQFWLSWDRKMAALRLPMKEWGIDPKQVHYEDYDDWNKGCAQLEKLQVSCPFQTIIVDSATSCADTTLRQTVRLKKGVTRQSGAAAGKVIASIPVNELEDYNAEAAALSELIALLKDIHIYHKVNVVLIAHVIQAEFKSSSGRTHMSRTIVTAGKRIAPKIPAYCGEVFHFNIEGGFEVGGGEGRYAMFTEHTGDDFARTTLPLERKIVFDDKPIYDTYLKPAITKLQQQSNPTTRF